MGTCGLKGKIWENIENIGENMGMLDFGTFSPCL
jgi:hypothetical protein